MPPNQYTINFVSNFIKNLAIAENIKLVPKIEDVLFKLLENVEVTKAARTDHISRKLLKDGARTLAKPIIELCNISMALGSFHDAWKNANVII